MNDDTSQLTINSSNNQVQKPREVCQRGGFGVPVSPGRAPSTRHGVRFSVPAGFCSPRSRWTTGSAMAFLGVGVKGAAAPTGARPVTAAAAGYREPNGANGRRAVREAWVGHLVP